jgi:hypothetical protein
VSEAVVEFLFLNDGYVPLRAFHLSSVEGWVVKFAVVPVAQ